MSFLSSFLIKTNLVIQSRSKKFPFCVYLVIKKLCHSILVQVIISLTGKE